MMPYVNIGAAGLAKRHSPRKLLLHFDGTDGDTTTVDSSIYNNAVVLSGHTLEDTDPKTGFGATSLYSPGTGTVSTYVLNTPELQMAGAQPEWTMQMWIKPATVAAGVRTIATKRATSSAYGWFVWMINAATMQFYISQNGTSWGVQDTTAGTITANVWQHVALERYNDYVTAYIGGVITGGAAISGPAVNDTQTFKIFGEGSANQFNGLGNEFVLDTIALYKGLAFTPPTEKLIP
jgi:hypothetical protein